MYYSVLFGGQAVILDPKSERGNWKKTLPEIAHEINIVNLTSDKGNAGLLDPFVIMKNVKDAESLAIDILTFLTGISSRDGEKFPVLRKAVRSVTQSDSRGSVSYTHLDVYKRQEYMGRTLYLGSLKSDVYFCIYEKDYEQYVKLGTPLEEADIINRFEIRLRNERAYYAVRDLLTYYDAGQTTFSIINQYVRFRCV